MPRPKLHKREETLRKALAFFWKNGFSGGSTRELGQALEMHPGSIYSSFGSKEDLCLETVELYAKESGQEFENGLSGPDFFASLSEYLRKQLSAKDRPSLCFLVKTYSSQLGKDQKLATRARELAQCFRETLKARVARAQDDGQIDENIDPETFGTLIQVQIMGLRCLADSAPEPMILQRAISDVVELLKLAGNPDSLKG